MATICACCEQPVGDLSSSVCDAFWGMRSEANGDLQSVLPCDHGADSQNNKEVVPANSLPFVCCLCSRVTVQSGQVLGKRCRSCSQASACCCQLLLCRALVQMSHVTRVYRPETFHGFHDGSTHWTSQGHRHFYTDAVGGKHFIGPFQAQLW